MEHITPLQSSQEEVQKKKPQQPNVHRISSDEEGETDVETEDSSSGSSGCESMYDSQFDSEDDIDDFLFDTYIDQDAEYFGVGEEKVNQGDNEVGQEEENEGDEDELRSLCDSDEDNPTFPVFNARIDMANPVFKLWMIFKSHKEVKEAVKSYSIKHGKEIKFKKNESIRVRAVCKDGCPWVLFASKMHDSSNMQIKTLNDEHRCNRQFKNIHVNSRWLSEQYLHTFRSNPKIPMKCFRETVMKDHVVNVFMSQAYRTRRKAMTKIEGTYAEQYGKLWDYMEEVRRSNPGSTIVMKVDEQTLSAPQPRFIRLYMCFAACKVGFMAGCRPFIGVDGCHLKGPHKGVLLAAIGVDANNCMFPIAVAVVEGETKSSWSWFLELLKDDVGIVNQYGWTFMSDKQKGLIPAFEAVLPLVEHRYIHMLILRLILMHLTT